MIFIFLHHSRAYAEDPGHPKKLVDTLSTWKAVVRKYLLILVYIVGASMATAPYTDLRKMFELHVYRERPGRDQILGAEQVSSGLHGM